jgi:hypothetical protein
MFPPVEGGAATLAPSHAVAQLTQPSWRAEKELSLEKMNGCACARRVAGEKEKETMT